MRKAIMILGTILIATVILISGSVVAIWYHIIYLYDDYQCTNPTYALYSPDGDHATIGENDPEVLGKIILDLGSGNEMGSNQNFTVFADTNLNETYDVSVISSDLTAMIMVGSGWDTEDCEFYTPSTPVVLWRYIQINATSGYIVFNEPVDVIYGPEVDAVGYWTP